MERAMTQHCGRPRGRNFPAARLLAACALGLVAGAFAATCLVTPAEAAPHDTASVDRLMVVDCLLPGQVRRLGTQMTFLTARSAVKTSAGDCEIRGGEYVAYDRSTYASALKVWLPIAQGGDKTAQTYVGEIYERGLGTAPDYAAAAQWYRKAAEQGHSRAQVNLGFLYERGLGVPKDPRQAVEWYRKSAGLQGAIALDGSSAPAASNAELEELRRELESTRRELDRARQQLEQERKRTQDEIDALKRQQQTAAGKGDATEVKRLEAELRARDQELSRRQAEVDRLERTSGDYRTRIASLERESTALKGEIGALVAQRDRANTELAALRGQAGEDAQRVEALRNDLARYREQAASRVDRAQVAALEAELKDREAEAAKRQAEIARLENEVKQSRDRLAKLEAAPPAPANPAVPIAAPTIQLIDPLLLVTRGPMAVKVRGNVNSREVIGRVTAPAGLFSLTLNDRGLATDDNGLFRTQVPLMRGTTPVSIIAIDRQGKRAVVDFALVTEGDVTEPVHKLIKASLGGDFGRYYALVIGNEKYQRLPRLDTAVADANAVGEVLKKRYGFEVTTLTNATRYQMMTALNQLSEKLTEKDNLLIYYAGHGELDRANLRAHWLPIDAEPNSDANWISASIITDHLNRMSANHVLVVADSCYSGAMTRSSIGQVESGVSDEARVKLLKVLLKSRSRTALTSGGVQPVIDGGGGKHSVFAKNFLAILNQTEDVIEARRLYNELAARVINDAARFKYEQKPEYAAIQFTGHEGGDFLFVPLN
jgi:hypothetical protein